MKNLLKQSDCSDEQRKAFCCQLNGLSYSIGLGGPVRGVMAHVWRGSGRCAFALGYRLLDLLYWISKAHGSGKEIVKRTVGDRIFGVLDALVEQRDTAIDR